MSLKDKLLKNTTSKITSVLEESMFFADRDMVTTPVPMVNVALSGRVDGGLSSGVTVLAGPSKHFKSGFALLMAAAYLKAHKDAVLLFYDTEFGTPANYYEMFGIDKNRVVHTPISDVEQLKHDIMNQLKNLERGERVVIVIDSVGNLASVKEIEDALSGKQVADMSRAKAIKSLFRMITPHSALLDIPIIVINHTYKEIGLFPKDVVSGGTGVYYSADNIWILGRRQDKEGTDVVGYDFVINVEKSRFVKEKSKIPISSSFETGISKWSGLFDIALELGYIEKINNQWYTSVLDKSKFHRKDKETDSEFWNAMLTDTELPDDLQKRYALSTTEMLGTDE